MTYLTVDNSVFITLELKDLQKGQTILLGQEELLGKLFNKIHISVEEKALPYIKLYTTGDISKLCGVASRTVTKWIDCGVLKGHKIPCTSHRRVTRESLIEFLNANGMELLLEKLQ